MRNSLYKNISKKIAIPLTLSVLLVGCSDSKSTDDSAVVATIEGTKITQSELTEALMNSYGAEVLDELIVNKLIELDAKKQGITVSEEDVSAELEELKASYGDTASYEEALAYNGTTEDEVMTNIKMYQLTKKLMDPRVEITDEEVATYFEENEESYVEEDKDVTFEDVKEDVYNTIYETRINEEYSKWLEEKYEEYKIVNKLTE